MTEGTALLWAIEAAGTGANVGTGVLIAPDVVLVHAAAVAALGAGDRMRVQLPAADAGEEADEVVDGQVDVVRNGLVLVALDHHARTPVTPLRLGDGGSTRDRVEASLARLAQAGGRNLPAAAKAPPASPGLEAKARIRPGGPGGPGGGGDGGNQQPPWCFFEPTWPGCPGYRR